MTTENIAHCVDLETMLHPWRSHPWPVILLEGTRQVGSEETPILARLASLLAEALPRAVFRSGNAQGADQAFFSGLRHLPAERREIVLPSPGSGAKRLLPGGLVVSLDDVPAADLPSLTAATLAASPDLAGLIRAYLAHGRKRHTVAAMYLLRDTLKVTGNADLGLAPAELGFFFVNRREPESGGTGHTIRVCRHLGVAVQTQESWWPWGGMENSEG